VSVRIDEYLRERAAGLESVGVPEARLNLEHLLSFRLGYSRLDLVSRRTEFLAPSVLAAVEADAVRLAAGEPLAYILGETPFHGLMLRTDRRALIPRPETEWLVDQVLACRAIWTGPAPCVADVGTGTGCIALALAAARPAARVLAVEADPAALALALENRGRLGLDDRVAMRLGDLLEGVPAGTLDAVVSNPPYIPSATCDTLDRHVKDFEPRLALDGGADGLAVIRRLARQARLCLKPDRPLWLEMGFDQGGAVAAVLKAEGFRDVEVRRDLAGLDRYACGWRPA
jgi:release factor glutamine methyltransferase